MVITVLRAPVAEESWGKLTNAYNKLAILLPPEIIQTFLVQDSHERTSWEIITIWRSAADLQKMRSSGQTPTGVVIFNAADAKPELAVFDVVSQAGL